MIEVRFSVGAKLGYGPALGSVGAEKDAVRSEVGKVARLVGSSGRLVPIVEDGTGFFFGSLPDCDQRE